MHISKAISCLFILLLTMSHLTKHQKPMPTFAAKFYDPQGVFLGDFGKTDSNSPIYIVSCALLFPYKLHACDAPITPKDIVELVGTEIIDDRHTPILELNLHVGLCKLPPKEHRDEIQHAIEKTHLDPEIPHKIDSIDYEIGGCGYHNNAGQLLHLRAKDGLSSSRNTYPSVEVFNAIDYETKVDSNQQLITDSGSKLIYESRVEYTWHTHPPKIKK